MKLFLDDRDWHLGGHGAPDMCLARVIAHAEEFLDAQVMFDYLKNNSTCHLFLCSAATVKGGGAVLLVRRATVLPDSGSLKQVPRRCLG